MSRLTALACSLVWLLTACSGGDGGDPDQTPPAASPAPAQSAPGASAPKAPRAGACYRLRYRDALAPTVDRPVVPCRRKHTSVTFHVGRLDLRHRGREVPVDSPRVQRTVAAACPDRLSDYLGGTDQDLRLSVLTTVWFTPSLADAEDGARWFRCDVVASGPQRSLVALPQPDRLRGILSDPARRDELALCASAEPGTAGFERVPCSRRHTWRAVLSVDLGSGAYPSSDELSELMTAPCTDAARERADDPLDFTWSEERPTREQWARGQRHGTCWSPDAG